MNAVVVITGTLVSQLTGEVSDLVYYLPLPGTYVLASVFVFVVLLMLFVIVQRFQVWALTLSLILSVLFVPFVLTPFGFYWIIFAGIIMIISSLAKFFYKITS